eukprot:g2468.t1
MGFCSCGFERLADSTIWSKRIRIGNYAFDVLFCILAIVGISYGFTYSLGDLGKLLNSFYPTYMLTVSGFAALIAAVNFDATRLNLPRMYLIHVMMLLALLIVNVVLADYEEEDEDVQTDNRDNWITLTEDTKRSLQGEYQCCGWETVTDNPALPCTLGLGPCKPILVPELNDRVDSVNSFMGCMVAFEVLAIIWGAIYSRILVIQYHRRVEKNDKTAKREEEEERTRLLRNSEILRRGTFLENGRDV